MLKASLIVLNVVLAAILFYAITLVAPEGWYQANFWSSSKIITVFLTSVTVVLTVLAIILALGAFFGYREIKEIVQTEVSKRVDEEVSKRLPEVVSEQFDEFLQSRAIWSQFAGGKDDK